jgi:hypothetical protein
MALVPITDHVRRAILNLPPVYWGKPRIASCLRALVEEVQELEDAVWDVLTLRSIETATGARLQALGRLVGEPDLGYDQETYRVLIRVRIVINRSRGAASNFTSVGSIITTGKTTVEDTDPATAYVEIEQGSLVNAIDIGAILKILRETRAGGVALDVAINPGADLALRFGDASDTVLPDPSVGTFGDASNTVVRPTAGGPLWFIGTL